VSTPPRRRSAAPDADALDELRTPAPRLTRAAAEDPVLTASRGADPAPPAPAPDPAAGESPTGAGDSGPEPVRVSARLDGALVDRVKNAVDALGAHEDDPRSLTELLETALWTEVHRLEDLRNDGEPFRARRTTKLKTGRRVS